MSCRWHNRLLRALIALVTLGAPLAVTTQALAQTAPPAPAFTEQDGLRVMDQMRQALEANSRGRLLKLFDASRMPGFAAFRDELSQFFLRYQNMRAQYRVQQVSQDGPLGALVCDFTLEADSTTDGSPSLRRNVQLRLVLSSDGKDWRIADLSPRTVFR